MDWDIIIHTILDTVKDDNLREEIYRKLLEESEDFENAEESLGSDEVFDRVFEDTYSEYDEEDEDIYGADDDFGYDDE